MSESCPYAGRDSAEDGSIKFYKYLKGKSSAMLYEQFSEFKYKYWYREFLCKGYYVDTTRKNVNRIAKYTQNQLKADGAGWTIKHHFTQPVYGAQGIILPQSAAVLTCPQGTEGFVRIWSTTRLTHGCLLAIFFTVIPIWNIRWEKKKNFINAHHDTAYKIFNIFLCYSNAVLPMCNGISIPNQLFDSRLLMI